jgi:hypothetical protein
MPRSERRKRFSREPERESDFEKLSVEKLEKVFPFSLASASQPSRFAGDVKLLLRGEVSSEKFDDFP